MEGEGMVAVVRGLRDSRLAVTLMDGSRQYTLMPNAIATTTPRHRSPVTNSSVSTQQSPAKNMADSSTEPSFPQCDSGIQAVDGRYASTYRTTHCHVRPTSPPVQLAEFPPQRPEICPGQGNFQVGGQGSGMTHPPIKAITPNNFRGGLSWPDRGSVCSPRPSHEPDAFANSLRKYPNLSPDRSSEVVERLINYTQAKGISRTFPRNQGSPTRLSEPGSHHTFDLKGCPRSSRLYEPEILVRSTKKDEAPTRDKKKDDHSDFRLRGYDVRCIRDMSKRLRESVKTISSYPYNQPVCPTIKEINHYDQVHDQSSVNSVNMEIQAAVKMISRQVATVQRDKPPGKTIAVPDSPPASADERNAEGDCLLDPSLNTQTSFKSIQTTSCLSDTTLKPRKSAQTVFSSIDFFSRPNRPKSMEGRKSKSQENIKVTNEDLRRSLLELIEDVSTCTKSKKRIRDELIKKLFDTEITEKDDKKKEIEKVKRERCHKYVSTYWPSGCDFVGDFEELLNKLKHWNGDSKNRYDKYNVRNAEYKQLDFVLKDWISSLNIKNKDNLDRGDVLHSLEDQIKTVFKDRTKRDFDLKAEVVRIIGEIPIEVNSGYTKTSYLHRLVDVLFRRLKSVVINQQNERNKKLLNKSRKIFSKDDVKDFLKTHLTGLFEECNIDICENVMHALQNDMRDILMDSIDCIRCGHFDDARDEMKVVFQDLGQLTDSQRDYVIKVILQNLQVMLNDHNYSYTYTILHSNVSGQNSRNANGTVVGMSGVTEGDLIANLDFYTNQLSIKIHEWLDTLNIPQIKDRGFREVVVNDLAGDIVDRHKYLELNPKVRGSEDDELENLKYQIFKWINKLVGEDNTETIAHAQDLMKKIKSVPLPKLTNSQIEKPLPFDPMRPCLNETGVTCRTEKSKKKLKGPCCTNGSCPNTPRPTPSQDPCCTNAYCPHAPRPTRSQEPCCTNACCSNAPRNTPSQELPKRKPCCSSASCQYSFQMNQDATDRKPVYTDVSTSVQSYPGYSLHSAQISQGGYVPQGSYGQDTNANQGPIQTSQGQQYGLQDSYGLDPNQNQSQFKQGVYGPQGPYSQDPNQGPSQFSQGPQGPYGQYANQVQSQFSQSPQGQYGPDPNQGRSQFSQGPQGPYGQDANQVQSQFSQSPQGQYGQDPNQNPQGQYGQSPNQGQFQFSKGPQGQYVQDPNQGQYQFSQGPQDPNQGQSQFSQETQDQYGQDPNQGQSQYSQDPYGYQSPYGLDPNQGQISQGAYGPQGSYGLGPNQGPGYLSAPGTYGIINGSPGQLPPGQNIQNGPYGQAGPVGPAGVGGFDLQIPNQQWDMPPMYQPGMSVPEGNYQGDPGAVLTTQQGVAISNGPGSVQGAQNSSPQAQIPYKHGYSIGAGLVNTGEACCPFQEYSVLSPSVKHLNDQYDAYLKDWVHRIPIASSNPEQQDAAEKIRLAFYTGIWKAITKLRLDPEIFSNPYYYQDQFDDEIDGLFATVPKSKELDDVKDKLKTELLEKTVAVNNYIKMTNANASFKQQIIESIENNLPKRINAVNLKEFQKQNEEVLKMELAEYFILYMRFKDEDNLKANVYKTNFLRKLEQFLTILKTNYGADLKQTNTYATDILNSLDKIPILNKYALQDEADDILLSIEVENWISDLPVTSDEIEPLEKRRIRDAIVKKVQEVGKIVAYTDCTFSQPLKEELPKILERLPIQPGTNLDFMMEELSNRVKYLTRSTKPQSSEPRNYEDFGKNFLASSSLTGQETPKFVVGNVFQSNSSKNWPNFSVKGLHQYQSHFKDQSKTASTILNFSQEQQSLSYQTYEQKTSGQQPVVRNNPVPTYLDSANGARETYFIPEIPSSGFQHNVQGTSVSRQTNVHGRSSLGNQTNEQKIPLERTANVQQNSSLEFQTDDQEYPSWALQTNVQKTSSSGFKPYVQTSPSQVFQANVQGTPTLGFQPNVQGNPPSKPLENLSLPGLQSNVQPGTETVPFLVPCCINLSCANRPRSLSPGVSTVTPISQVRPDLYNQNQVLTPGFPQAGPGGEVANVRQYSQVPQDTYAQSSLATNGQHQSLGPPSVPYGQVINNVPGSPEQQSSNAPQQIQIPQGTYDSNRPIAFSQASGIGPGLPTEPNSYAQSNQPQSNGPITTPKQTEINPGNNISAPTNRVDKLSTTPLSSQAPQGSYDKNVPIVYSQPQSYNPISAIAGQVAFSPDGKTRTADQNSGAPQRANDQSNFAASKKAHSNIPIPVSRGKVQDSRPLGRQASPAARYSKLPQDQYGQSRLIPNNQAQYGSSISAPAGQGKEGPRVRPPNAPRISFAPHVTDKKNFVPYNQGPFVGQAPDGQENEQCYCRCGTVPKKQIPTEKEDNKSLNIKEKNIFNIKAVQTAFSTIDIHTTKCKYCEIRSKSQEELTKVTKRQEVIKRKDNGMLDLHPEVTEWFEIHRDKVKVKMWGDKMQKLADKLKTPGGEEKLRMKIEKYLKKVPDQFPEGGEDGQEFRKQLPDDIIRKLKMKYLTPIEPDCVQNVYRMELSNYCSRFKTENFKRVIINWLKNLNIKKKDFLGRTVKKDDVLKYVTEKLEPLVLNRPACDTDYKDALKSNIIDIVEDLPLVIGRHNKEFVVNRVSDGLINDILSIETKIPTSYIQPTVSEIKEFVKDEITFFLEKVHKAISTKRMECLETELVDILLDLASVSDIDNYIVEDITTIFKETGKLSEYKARYFSNVLLRDYKEFFFRQSFFNENGKIDSGNPKVYSEVQNLEDAENQDDATYSVYSQQLVDEINKWICNITIPNKNKSLIAVVVKELASDIVDRHKYLVMNPNSKRTDAEESELLKYEIFKWTSKLTGDDNTTVLDYAQELLDKINTIPKSVIPTTFNNKPALPPPADLTFESKPNIETLSDLICDWFEELPEEVYQYANLNSELVEDLAKDIYKNYDNIYPGLIDDMVDQWTDEVFNKKLNRNDAEKLKNRIKNNIQRHTKENEKKDPKQEKVMIRSYEDIVDDWIDTVPMDPKKVGNFIKNRNEFIHELGLKIYQINLKYNKAPNDVKVKVLQEEITEWMKKLPLNIDALTSLPDKYNMNKYASKLVVKIQECNFDASPNLRATLKEQLIVDQIKVAMMEWLKKQPLYTNNNCTKAKKHQERIIKELAIKINERIRDGHNPEIVMFDHIKMLDPAQSVNFVKNTVSQLKLHLQNYKFGDISLQLTDDDILLSNIEVWMENLHLDVSDITRFNDQKTEFINSMQSLRSSGSDSAVIKKEIITFLKSLMLVNNRKLDEKTLNEESFKLLKSITGVKNDGVSSKSYVVNTNEIICKTIKDWANTLPLKPIYCPRELRWFIDEITSAIISLLEHLKCNATKDNDQVIHREIINYLRKFPLLQQTTENNIMTASKELTSKLKNINLFGCEGCYNDDARNVTVYGVALDSINTTITSDTTDFTIESIKEEDVNANLERYTKQLVRQITEWFVGLNLRNVQEEGFKEVVINDLAGDIVDRHKYLELNPESRGSNEDELEHLKYQIFKWINKLVGEENLETIEHAGDLMARIRSIPVPMLVKPSANITNTQMNSSMPVCCTPKKFPQVLTAPHCCQPSYNKPVGMQQVTQPAANVYPGMSSPSPNTTEYSIEEVSGYGGPNESFTPQLAKRMSGPGPTENFTPETTSPADRRSISVSPQPGRPSFVASPQPTDKRMSNPTALSASPTPGRSSFGVPSPPTDKRSSSPAALSAPPQPGRSSFGASPQPTDKRMSSPAALTAPPQPGMTSFGVPSIPTEKRSSSPAALTTPNIQQYGYETPPSTGASSGLSSQVSGKRMSNPNAMINAYVDQYSSDKTSPVRRSVSGSPQAGRLSTQSTGKLMTSPDIPTNVNVEKHSSYTPPPSAGVSSKASSQSAGKRVSITDARANANDTNGSETPPPPGKGTFEVVKRQSIRRMSTSDPSAGAGVSSPSPGSGVGTLEVLSPQSAKTISSPTAIANLNTGSSLELAAQAGKPSFGIPAQPTATRMSTPSSSTNSNKAQYSSVASQIADEGATGVSESGSSRTGCCPLAISPSARMGLEDPVGSYPLKCCPDLTPPPPPSTPQEGTKEAIYEKYQKIFREKCNALQIESSSPESEKLADLARTGIYNGIVKTFFKLKADPEIENDYGYFELMLEEKIDEMLDILPQTEDFKSRRHPWKLDILTNAINMLDELHGLSDRPSFRQRVRNKFNRKFARELELEECFLLQQGFLAEMADAYILETKYKEENPVKANIYKNRLMKKIDDLTNHLAKEHNAGFRFFKKAQLARIAMKVLEQVPIPSDDILKAEAEEIQLADEVEKWYKELPTKPLVNETDGVLRKRMTDLLAKKLYDIEKRANNSDGSKEEQMKHEMSQFLEKRAKLQEDQDLNINFMVDELNNRLKNRWLKDPVDYSDFENENPVSSTFAQVNNNEGYLAPLMDAATSTGQPQGQMYQDSPHGPPRNRPSLSQSVQSGPNQTYASQGVPMGVSQQQTPHYSGYGPQSAMIPSQGYLSQSINGVPFQSIPPNQPPDRAGYEAGFVPNNTGYGSQQQQMMQGPGSNRMPGTYVETGQRAPNSGYIPQQNMRSPSRSGPGPGNGYMTNGPPIQHMAHTCPRNMRLGPHSGHVASSPRMHCSNQPFVQCGGRHGSIPHVQVTDPTMNGQQRPYGMQGQVKHSTSYPSQGQNPSQPDHGGSYGPTPSNGAGATAQVSPDGREMDNDYVLRCKCLEAYRRRRRCFEFDDRCLRYSPYRYNY